MTYSEEDLRRIALCPLLDGSGDNTDLCTRALLTYALKKSFLGSPPTLENIREFYTHLWNTAYFPGVDPKSWVIPPIKSGTPYWRGIHLGRTISFRIFSLMVKYEIMHLEQLYNLILNGYTIQGRYALIRKRTKGAVPNVLVTYTHAPTIQHDMIVPPDPVSLSRYVNVKMSSMHKEVYVLHYPLLKGKEWVNKHINEPLAKQYLTSMLRVLATDPSYPTPGDHCRDCKTKRCMGVLSLDR